MNIQVKSKLKWQKEFIIWKKFQEIPQALAQRDRDRKYKSN